MVQAVSLYADHFHYLSVIGNPESDVLFQQDNADYHKDWINSKIINKKEKWNENKETEKKGSSVENDFRRTHTQHRNLPATEDHWAHHGERMFKNKLFPAVIDFLILNQLIKSNYTWNGSVKRTYTNYFLVHA